MVRQENRILELNDIRALLAGGKYELSRHALRRVVERNLSSDMIRQAGANAELIEDYPDDKYAPSSLLLGFTAASVPLHLQVCRADAEAVKIITLYVPDPAEWIDNRRRKAKS